MKELLMNILIPKLNNSLKHTKMKYFYFESNTDSVKFYKLPDNDYYLIEDVYLLMEITH